jgi:hypothetical protein
MITVIEESIKVDTEAILVAGDKYWSNYHKEIIVVFNKNHAAALNLMNENAFGTLKEIDFNWKIIE